MKSSTQIFILILLVFSVAANIYFGAQFKELNSELAKLHQPASNVIDDNNGIHFIWNDDEESIPQDGELIKIEFTDENTVYLTPTEINE